jgi:hypothetical protein
MDMVPLQQVHQKLPKRAVTLDSGYCSSCCQEGGGQGEGTRWNDDDVPPKFGAAALFRLRVQRVVDFCDGSYEFGAARRMCEEKERGTKGAKNKEKELVSDMLAILMCHLRAKGSRIRKGLMSPQLRVDRDLLQQGGVEIGFP